MILFYDLGCANDSSLIDKGGPYYTERADQNQFYNYFLNLKMDEVIAIAHRPQSMIKYCAFGGIPTYSPDCTDLIRGSVKMFTPANGVCYSFNFQRLGSQKVSASSVYGGGEFGLQLVLDIEGKCIKRLKYNPT